MRYKKIIVLATLLLCLFAVSAVNAAENDAGNIVGEEIQDNNAFTEDLTSNIDENFLNAEAKTFTELNSIINDNTKADIYLNCNYTYNPDSDSIFEEGINLTRDVTIHGNGFAINGDETARIFKVTQGNVVFQDIVFVNGKGFRGGAIYGKCTAVNCTFIGNSVGHGGEGGAIYGKCTAVNCTFRDNHAYQGGAMVSGSAVNCTFINNSASNYGGGAMSAGSAVNCTFINNSARYGGAMSGGSCANCTFINNSAWDYGGAMSGKGSSAENCTFINNSAWDYGGAMSYVSAAVNCTFINNSASNYGGGMYDGSAVNCTFINNSAINKGGGAIFSGSAENCTFVNNDVIGVDTVNCTFIPMATVIAAQNLTTDYGVSKKLIITLMDIDGNVLSGAKITVLLNNKSYKEHTDSNGEVSINIPNNLNPNTYKATISYAGDIEYLPSDTTANIAVNKATVDILCDDLSMDYNDGSELIATLTHATTGNAIADENVKINLNGADTTVKTDSQGQVKLSLNGLTPSEYPAIISYAGNSKYSLSTKTAKVIVNKADTIISSTANSTKLVATLTHGITGKAISGAKIVVNINGKDYDLKTDSKGQIKLSTTSSGSTATITYAGNAKYNPSSIIVNTKENIIISAVYDANNNEIIATLTNEATDKPITNANVQININDASTTVKSNTKGQLKVSTAYLPLGTYIATISYAGNNKYNPSSTSISVDVKTNVIITDIYGDSTQLIATLTNRATGKPVTSANMQVDINGVKTTVKSNSKGQISLNTSNLGLTSYTATISYAGNNKYNPSNATTTIDINKANMKITYVYNAEKQELVATLKNSKTGKAVSNANMAVDVNGVKATLKSNSKGQITFSTADFTPGTYLGTISYWGNAKYNPISVAFKVDA